VELTAQSMQDSSRMTISSSVTFPLRLKLMDTQRRSFFCEDTKIQRESLLRQQASEPDRKKGTTFLGLVILWIKLYHLDVTSQITTVAILLA
jgi:hypothetical protein